MGQESRFFGAGFNYSNVRNISFQGNVVDLPAVFGITGIWTGSNGMLATIATNQNFQGFVLNGYNFGSGRIQSIRFDAGIDVKTKSYTADIIVYDSGDLFNLTGTFYNTINTSGWQYLQDFSESYDFTRKENGGYSYNHSASIRFNSGVGDLNAIAAAQALAKSIFTGSNLGVAFYSGYTNKNGKRFYNENYNLIDNGCRFDETFDFDSDSGSYSFIRTNQFVLEQNGIINVSENGQLRGIVDPTFISAENALGTAMADSYNRCNLVFGLYAPSNSYPLVSTPNISSRTIDIFQNNLNYSVNFTNDISNKNRYTWDYTQTVTYDEVVARVTENGSVIGRGENRDLAYQNAKNGFNNDVVTGIGYRADSFYTQWDGATTHFLKSKQQRFAPPRGTIEYSYEFSNEATLVGTNGIKRIEVQLDTNAPIYRYSKFGIFNAKEIVQDEQTSTLGTQSTSLNLIGDCNTQVPLSTYLASAIPVINTYAPAGLDVIITDAAYSFTPNRNITTVNINYEFSKLVNKTISIL